MIVLAAVAGMANTAQAQYIEINATNFPNENFRTHVKQYDTDSDGFLGSDEIAAVTSINVSSQNIADLKGIEHFIALTELFCYNNQLTTLDVSNCTALKELSCSSNQLSSLDVSNCTALKYLNCSSNQLSSLDVSNCTALVELDCSYNQLSTLVVSNCTALTYLDCYSNQLTSLDVSNCTALTYLDCSSNQLTSLVMSNCTALTILYCSSNQLTVLDVSKNTALTELICAINHLTALDVSANIALYTLYCYSNHLTALDVSANTALTTLYCFSNQIQADEMLALVNSLPTVTNGEFYVVDTQDSDEGNVITKSQVAIATGKNWKVYDYNGKNKVEYAGDLGIEINETNFPDNNFRSYVSTSYDTDSDGYLSYEEIAAITTIDVYNKNIADLKGIEHFTALTELHCHYNQLTTLDVSNNTALTELNCAYNQLTKLDVSKNTALTELWCANNQLTALDLSANTALTKFSCGYNQLSTLDVSNNTALTELSCDHNQLITLDLLANTTLTRLSCTSNQLTVLDVSANTALISLSCQFNQLSTLNVSANTALRFLYCLDNQLTTLDVSNCTALTELSCEGNQLTALDVSNCTALEKLECYDNQLTALNVSANTALTDLYCYNNQLSTLDVSNCTALKQLYCDDNQLTTLDVSANTALTRLYCYNNQLTVLDVSKNTALTTLICVNNQLTALDVSANTALTELYCFGNQIQADEMLALVNSLPTVTNGEFYVVDTQDSNEGNVITKAQVAIAQSKGWTVYDLDYKGQTAVEYAGVEEYVLTLGIPANGTLTATPNGSVGEGTAIILTATPDEGYMLKTLKAYRTGDESQTVAISENKFTMPAYDVTVEAEFEAITYTLTYAAGAGGTIQGSATQTVAHGQSGTEVEAKPNEGYKFVKWSDGRTTAKRTDSNVQANLSVTAEFEKSSTTGLFDTQLDALSVYPNPTAGQLWISVPELAEGTAAEVLVYNAAGQLLQRVAARAASTGSAASRLSIDLSGYPAGVYLISVGNAVAKVVKQ